MSIKMCRFSCIIGPSFCCFKLISLKSFCLFPLQGPVAVKVQVPNMQDKTEWKLNGQVLNFTVPLTDQVCMLAPHPPPSPYFFCFGKCMSYLSMCNAMSPQVSVIKVKIHEATGMPAGKQKLQYEVNVHFDPFFNLNASFTVSVG